MVVREKFVGNYNFMRIIDCVFGKKFCDRTSSAVVKGRASKSVNQS